MSPRLKELNDNPYIKESSHYSCQVIALFSCQVNALLFEHRLKDRSQEGYSVYDRFMEIWLREDCLAFAWHFT